MEIKDIKYFLAYLLPAAVFSGIILGDIWTFSGVVLAFVIIPVLEQILPLKTANHSGEENKIREKSTFFDVLIYLNLPIVYGLILLLLSKLSNSDYSLSEKTGLILSTGIMLGSNGINVAHEIGHRKGKLPYIAARLLLLPSLYMHFTTEHNRGHHLHVGTPEDPATSRLNENVFSFWLRSVTGTFMSAWEIQKSDLKKSGKSYLSFSNEMLIYQFLQVVWIVSIWGIWGPFHALAAVMIALISVLLLESINYIEHYGLLRKKGADGRYERVELFHSWNSDHQMGRIMLYELTRHSDHHYKASKKYQILNHYDESPQLPYGYPASILLALVPPLWFRVMNPRAEAWKMAHL